MLKFLRIISCVFWGAIALVFGLGVVLSGLQRMTGPAAAFTVAIGVVVIAAAYGMHRLTCRGINRIGQRQA